MGTRQIAEIAGEYLRKGSRHIEGHKHVKWQDQRLKTDIALKLLFNVAVNGELVAVVMAMVRTFLRRPAVKQPPTASDRKQFSGGAHLRPARTNPLREAPNNELINGFSTYPVRSYFGNNFI